MSNKVDLEVLRSIFKDDQPVFAICEVLENEILIDRTGARAKLLIIADDREVIARYTFGAASEGGGFFQIPRVGDWVLVAFIGFEQAYILARLPSISDLIPLEVQLSNDTTVGSQAGTKLHLHSDTRVNIGKKGLLEPDEPLVLGNVMGDLIEELISKIEDLTAIVKSGDHVLTTSPGNPTAPNTLITPDLTAIETALATARSTYLTTPTTNIKSQIAFTERG